MPGSGDSVHPLVSVLRSIDTRLVELGQSAGVLKFYMYLMKVNHSMLTVPLTCKNLLPTVEIARELLNADWFSLCMANVA